MNALLLLRQRSLFGDRAPPQTGPSTRPEHELEHWLEEELLRHCSSAYCNNVPPLPRSTIALAFSPDGRLLASTHGDHTVKITCCKTGLCLKILREHERTPWAVKFHPKDSNVLASGSLDSTVRVWDLSKGECSAFYNFGRPISSIAFTPDGCKLAIASGHRLYMWSYALKTLRPNCNQEEELVLLLKTRRSLRAVHFHPQGAPLLLTAEVTSGVPDSKHSKAAYPLEYTGVVGGIEMDERRRRHSHRHREAAGDRHLALNPQAFGEQLSQALRALQTSSSPEHANDLVPLAIQGMTLKPEADPAAERGPSSSCSRQPRAEGNDFLSALPGRLRKKAEEAEKRSKTPSEAAVPSRQPEKEVDKLEEHAKEKLIRQETSSSEHAQGFCELAFASTSSQTEVEQDAKSSAESKKARPLISTHKLSPNAKPFQPQGLPDLAERLAVRQREEAADLTKQQAVEQISGSGQGTSHVTQDCSLVDWMHMARRIGGPVPPQSDFAAEGLETQGGAFHGSQSDCPHGRSIAMVPEDEQILAQNCSQAGEDRPSRPAHLEWDWRYPIAPYVPPPNPQPLQRPSLRRSRNSVLPAIGAFGAQAAAPAADAAASTGERSNGKDAGCQVLVRLWRYQQSGKPALEMLMLAVQNAVLCSDMGLSISPCGKMLALCASSSEAIDQLNPEAKEDKAYELQLYSLEGKGFGEVIASRSIKAAHCLTAIQFSPGSRHIMLAYGRRDPSLQQHLQEGDARSIVSLNTVLEVYRVQDMGIVRVLPSADDEINTALFHPFMGCGLAYGTKEGRLRILTHISRPLLSSKKGEGQGWFEDELLAASQEANSHSSEEEA